jgi:type I restriction enzyme S subunit
MELKQGYKQTELGVIPQEWDVKSLGELGEVKMCKRIFHFQTKSQGDIPFYKIGTFGKDPDAYITNELYLNFRQKFSFPKKGTLLISAAGTIGRTIIYDGKPSYFQDSNIVWIDNDERILPNRLLFHILQAVNYNTEGGTIQRLYNSILKSTKFIYPPLPEQTAIANALSDMDALISQTEKLIEKKKAIKQGAMQELLKPKDGWVTKKLGDVCEIFGRIGFRGYTVEDIVSEHEGALSLSPSNIIDGKLSFKKCTYISWDKYYESPEIMVNEGDIILVKTASIGKNCIIKRLETKATVNPQIVVLKKFRMDNILLGYLISSPIVQNQIKTKMVGGVLATLSQEEIKNFLITIPESSSEQKNISKILFDLDEMTTLLENKIQKLKQQKQGMMQALLTGKIRLVS